MRKWLQSSGFYIIYGDEYDKKGSDKYNSFWYPDLKALNEKTSELFRRLHKGQWKICGVTPLTRSYTFSQYESGSSWGWGIGYGINPIIGMEVLVQREIEISDEEYAERMGCLNKQEQLEELKQKLPALQEAVQQDQSLKLVVEEKKGLLGGVKFVLNDTSYKTREEAERTLASLKTACAERAAELENLQREVQQLTTEVDALESKYSDMK